MPVNDITIKDYLESATEAARRVRFATVILMVVTVLVFAGYLNSSQSAWGFLRLDSYTKRSFQLTTRVKSLEDCLQTHDGATYEMCEALYKASLQYGRASYELDCLQTVGSTEACSKRSDQFLSLATIEGEYNCGGQSCSDFTGKGRLECYRCAKNDAEDMVRDLRRSVIDKAYYVTAPFFGVNFDINDLGIVGGLSLVVVLMMLRLNLRSYIVSLRVGFKAAFKTDEADEFYEILASRQVFVFPHLRAENQTRKVGQTERRWRRSRIRARLYLPVSKSIRNFKYGAKLMVWSLTESPRFKGSRHRKRHIRALIRRLREDPQPTANRPTTNWAANPQPYLRRIPKLISLMPSLVFGLVVWNDFQSRAGAYEYSVGRTLLGLTLNALFLALMIILGLWNVSKWFEIDFLWQHFRHRVDSGITRYHRPRR